MTADIIEPCGTCGHSGHIDERCKVLIEQECACGAPAQMCDCICYMAQSQFEQELQYWKDWVDTNLK